MLNPINTYRILGVLLAVICFSLVGSAVLISYIDNLQPCPLCIMQRIAFLFVGLMGLLAAVSPPTKILWRRISVLFTMVFGLIGAAIASWHVYLQYAPPSITCGPDLAYMMSNWTLAKWLPAVFRGAGECSKIDWTLMAISMPTWSAICFYAITGSAIVYLVRQKH